VAGAEGVRGSRGAGHQPQGAGHLDGRAGGYGWPELKEHVDTRALVRDIRGSGSFLKKRMCKRQQIIPMTWILGRGSVIRRTLFCPGR